MSNTFALLDPASLASVSGGLEFKAWFRQLGRGQNGQLMSGVEMRQTPYEKCLGGVTGRASWTPQQHKTTCGTPPNE